MIQKVVAKIQSNLEDITIVQVPREENGNVDTLAKMAVAKE